MKGKSEKSKKEYQKNNEKFLKVKSFIQTYHSQVIITLVFVLIIGWGISVSIPSDNKVAQVSVENKSNAFEVIFMDKSFGIVKEKEIATEIFEKAKDEFDKITEQKYKTDEKLQFNEVYAKKNQIAQQSEMISEITKYLIDKQDSLNRTSYVIEIENGVNIAVPNEQAVKTVLDAIQSRYTTGKEEFELKTLDFNDEEADVSFEKKEQNYMFDDEILRLKTATATYNNVEQDESKEGQEGQSEDGERVLDVVSVNFVENVKVEQQYVKPEEIVSASEAVALLTKEEEKPQIYNVQSGECLSIIGQKFDLELSEIKELNKEDKITEETVLQIDQPLIVSVPVPELSVVTQERVAFNAPVNRPVEYRKDDSQYVNYSKVIDSGENGEKLVTAEVIKINGKEQSRETVNELIVKDPKPQIVVKGTKSLPSKAATGSFRKPLYSYTLTSPYGKRWGSFHKGVDLATAKGNNVLAADGGKIIYAGWSGGYGYLVKIDHGKGITTYYGHNSKLYVKVGQKVAKGETIAAVGSTGNSTGPHVHFEIRINGQTVNPFNYFE